MAAGPVIERLRRHPSPIVRRQLAAAGIDPERFSLGDLPRLPPIRPDDLDFEALTDPVGELRLTDAPDPVRLGTCERGGRTIVLTWTARDLRRAAESGARALARAGVSQGMKVANTLEGGFETPGSLVLGDAVETLGGLDIPLGPVRDDKTAFALRALLERIEVEILVTDRTTGSPLLDELVRHPPRGWIGTIWLGLDAPPELPGWHRRWVSVPEISVFAAVDCPHGSLHLDSEVTAEVRDSRLLLTRLSGDAPLLRYESGVSARIVGDRCPCGDAAPRLRLVQP